MTTTVEYREAIDIVCGERGHPLLRWRCSDDNPDAASRRAHRLLAVKLATDKLHSEPPTAEDLALQQFVARHGCGGCGG